MAGNRLTKQIVETFEDITERLPTEFLFEKLTEEVKESIKGIRVYRSNKTLSQEGVNKFKTCHGMAGTRYNIIAIDSLTTMHVIAHEYGHFVYDKNKSISYQQWYNVFITDAPRICKATHNIHYRQLHEFAAESIGLCMINLDIAEKIIPTTVCLLKEKGILADVKDIEEVRKECKTAVPAEVIKESFTKVEVEELLNTLKDDKVGTRIFYECIVYYQINEKRRRQAIAILDYMLTWGSTRPEELIDTMNKIYKFIFDKKLFVQIIQRIDSRVPIEGGRGSTFIIEEYACREYPSDNTAISLLRLIRDCDKFRCKLLLRQMPEKIQQEFNQYVDSENVSNSMQQTTPIKE